MKKLFFVLLIFIFSISANAQWKAYGPTSQVDGIIKYNDKIFAGSWKSVYFSANNAESWSATKSSFGGGATLFRCFAYSDKYIYAGFESSIYRSADEGLNWTKIMPDEYIGATCMRAYNDIMLFISTRGRFYKVAEKDLKFEEIKGSFSGYNLIVGKKDTVFLGGGSGLLISEDAGRNWREIMGGLGASIRDLKIRNDEVYVNNSGICFKSKDNGKSWIKCFDSLNLGSKLYSFYFDKNRIIAITEQGLKYSDDEGKNWIDANAGLPNSTISGLEANDSFYFLSNKTGIYRSNKGKISWEPMNKTLANTFVEHLVYTSAGLEARTGGFGVKGLFISKDYGVNWEILNQASTVYEKYFTFGRGKIISFDQKRVKYSSDNGKTWVEKSSGIDTNASLTTACILRDTIYIYGGGNTIYKADTNTLEWSEINMNLPAEGITIFAFKDNLYSYANDGFYKAYDNNTNWRFIGDLSAGYIVKMDVKGDKVISYMIDNSGDPHFIISTDLIHWFQFPIEIKSNKYFDYLIHESDIYALIGEQGIFKSTDEGETWTDFNNGLSNYEVVKFVQDSTHLYVATQGGGVNVFDFTDLYAAPSLIAPSNKAIKNPASITFNWSHSNEISKDLFELALDADFKNMKNSSEIKTGDITITNLISDTLYYWRVKSLFPNGDSKASETWTLSTKYVSNVGLMPGDFLSVAPNPANDNISVNYKFENAEKVNVYLMDVLGNKLYEANGLRNEEHYSINVSQFTAGIYYLVFDTGLNQIKEKIVIAK